MEIDAEEISEEEMTIERSDRMDKKVLEKQKKLEETEIIERKKKIDSEERKKLENMNKRKLSEKPKGQKQKVKKVKKENMVSNKEQLQTKTKYLVPNIKEIPQNCRHLFKIDDVMYVVPGDGSCRPSCATAYLFQDEVFGP